MIELDYTVDIVSQAATFFQDRVKSPLVSILSDIKFFFNASRVGFFSDEYFVFDIFLSSARSVHSE